MATQSFFEDLVLNTPEAVANLVAALDEADARGRLVIEGAHDPVEDEAETIAAFKRWGYHVKE